MSNQFNFGNGSDVFFTSDTHFGHGKIIEYCHRPFKSVEEMNEKLIENWNSVISDNSIVFHLGDFAFGGSQLWNETLSRLKGKIILILGNHDRNNMREGFMRRFDTVASQMQIEIGGKSIYLNHYPFLCFGGAWRGENATWQLFGHVHSGPGSKNGLDINRLVNLFPSQYDVGVDNNEYKPISFEAVAKKIHEQQQSLNLIRNNV